MSSSSPYNRALHTLALLTAAATFPLIFMGGLVTSHGAGMSVPDWPNSYGYNMFTFPPSKWVGGIFYEHTHRLAGTVVGMLSIALAITAYRFEPRRWARWLAYSVLAAVIFQGVLGGLRVVLVKLDLAIVHACFAQAFFCLTGSVCVVTSRWWIDFQGGMGFQPILHGLQSRATLFRTAAITCIIIYVQLIAGAVMRHEGAGLAVPDFPLSYGKLTPPLSDEALATANATRVYNLNLPAITRSQVLIHFLHRIGALLVTITVLTTATLALRSRIRNLQTLGVLLILLLTTQITLGAYVIWLRKPADITSLHVAVGALTLFTTFILTVRASRVAEPKQVTVKQVANDHFPADAALA